MGQKIEEAEGDLAAQEGVPRGKMPPRFAVVLFNDDYTTMEFVVEVLHRFFHKDQAEAVQIMLRIHEQGQGVAGIYDFEIAETKVAQVHQYAQVKNFPLRCALEPAI